MVRVVTRQLSCSVTNLTWRYRGILPLLLCFFFLSNRVSGHAGVILNNLRFFFRTVVTFRSLQVPTHRDINNKHPYSFSNNFSRAIILYTELVIDHKDNYFLTIPHHSMVIKKKK